MRQILLGLLLVSIGALIAIYGFPHTSEAPVLNEESSRDAAPAAADVEPRAEVPSVSSSPENEVVFECANDATLTAVFTRDIVGITLSDGRQFTLRQTSAPNGVRYEDAYNKIVLSGTESEVSVEENGSQTYSSCRVSP